MGLEVLAEAVAVVPAPEPERSRMERVLLAGVISMVISILAGPKFIEFLRRNELGQHIREEGPGPRRSSRARPRWAAS